MSRRLGIITAVLAGVFLFGVGPLAAEEGAPDRGEVEESCSDCYRVDAILVTGLLRTRRVVVERELLFEEGDVATLDDVEQSIQRIRNTGLFHRVEYELLDRNVATYGDDDERAHFAGGVEGRLLQIRVDERWTFTPGLRFGQGGQTFHLHLSVQEANLWGSYLQVGGSYARLGEANSFALFFSDPRFLNRRQGLSVEGALINRMHRFYDLDGEFQGGYLLTRRQGAMSLSREWRSWFRTGVHSSFWADTFSYDMVGEDRQEAQQGRGGLPERMETFRLGMSAQFGRIDQHGFQFSGTTLRAQVDQYFHFGGAGPRSLRLETTLRHYVDLPANSTLAVRGILGFSSLESEHLQFSAGGLSALRGTVDMRYHGPNYWLGNVEYRIPTIQTSWLIIENVFFVDAVNVTPYPAQVLNLTAATTGLGLRFISANIYGLAVRVDYAMPILGADGPGLSFGAGQFF